MIRVSPLDEVIGSDGVWEYIMNNEISFFEDELFIFEMPNVREQLYSMIVGLPTLEVLL